MVVKKIIHSTLLIKSFKHHKKIKKELLNFFNETSLSDLSTQKEDNIYKVDWKKSEDFTRPWVQLIYPDLNEHFLECTKILNYREFTLRNLWFQQYKKTGYHRWHTHSGNYTGVYYVDLNFKNPITEILNQYYDNKLVKFNAKEGDIILFPSNIVHRSPKNNSNKIKTIISFNLDFNEISEEYSKKLKKYDK